MHGEKALGLPLQPARSNKVGGCQGACLGKWQGSTLRKQWADTKPCHSKPCPKHLQALRIAAHRQFDKQPKATLSLIEIRAAPPAAAHKLASCHFPKRWQVGLQPARHVWISCLCRPAHPGAGAGGGAARAERQRAQVQRQAKAPGSHLGALLASGHVPAAATA